MNVNERKVSLVSPEEYSATIDKLTGTDEKERRKLMRYAGSKLTDELLVGVISKAFDFFHTRKESAPLSKSLLVQCGIIVELKRLHYADTKARRRKNCEQFIETLEKLRHARIKAISVQRKKRKKDRLYPLMGEIVDARHKGLSYQKICDWLEVAHKLKITREYLRRWLQNAKY